MFGKLNQSCLLPSEQKLLRSVMTEVSMHYDLWKSLSDTQKGGFLCERSVFPTWIFLSWAIFWRESSSCRCFINPNADILDNPTGSVLGCYKTFPWKKHHCLGQVQIVEELRNSSKAFSWDDQRGVWKLNRFWCLLKQLKQEAKSIFPFLPLWV